MTLSPCAWDITILRRIRRYGDDPTAALVARSFSRFGEHAAGWIVLAGLGAAVQPVQRRRWTAAAGSIVAAHGASVVLKHVVRRPRPVVPGLPALGTVHSQLSFPSAHSASTTAAAWTLGPLIGAPPLIAASTAMGLSRIVLGLHYPSDVVVGVALGAVVGAAGARLGTRWAQAAG